VPELTFARFMAAGGVAVLARLFADPASIRTFLSELGAEPGRLPNPESLPAHQFWTRTCQDIGNGMFPFGLVELVAHAARWFPGNRELRRLGALTETESAGATAAAARGPNGPANNDSTNNDPTNNDVANDTAKSGTLRVLCLLAAPWNAARLRLDVEHRTINEITSGLRSVSPVVHPATRIDDIIPHLLAARPDIVHFSGHGTQEGQLVFEDAVGLATPVSATNLARVFAAVGGVRCVVLNSCYNAAYGSVLLPSCPIVIGSVAPLSDRCATAFTKGFYTALSAGRDEAGAYRIGLAEMGLHDCDVSTMRMLTAKGVAA
jgi:hypothetical protein